MMWCTQPWSENRLILANADKFGRQQRQGAAGQNNPRIEYVSVNCRGCGGVNQIPKGTKAECEYCGMMIKTK